MKLETLQAGRALAAIAVVLFHSNATIVLQLGDAHARWAAFTIGKAGVEYFFVLSGFIMTYVHARDFGSRPAAKAYFFSRLTRIYPLFWVTLGLLALGQIALGRLEPRLADPASLLQTILLVPFSSGPFPLTVAWTLSHEILFYLIFGLTLLFGRAGLPVLALWFAGCAVPIVLPGHYEALGHPFGFLFSFNNLLFLFGIASALVFRRIGVAPAWTLLVVGLAGFALIGFLVIVGALGLPFLRTICFGLAAAAIVIALATLENRAKLGVPRLLTFLGDASYSIYLIHGPVIGVSLILLRKAGIAHHLHDSITFGALAIAGIIAGIVMHLAVEKPLLRFFRKYRSAVTRPVTG